jgi:hypothetical protein
VQPKQRELWPKSAGRVARAVVVAVNARGFRLNGRCSGIPECCIDEFIASYDGGRPRDPAGDHVGYVRCRACIRADRRVAQRPCLGIAEVGGEGECVCTALREQAIGLPWHVQLAWLDLVERAVLGRRSEPSRAKSDDAMANAR